MIRTARRPWRKAPTPGLRTEGSWEERASSRGMESGSEVTWCGFFLAKIVLSIVKSKKDICMRARNM